MKQAGDGQRFMSTVKLGPKGQIVIPKEVREMFSLEPGDSLLLLADAGRGIALQRSSVMSQIADAIFAGHGREVDGQAPEEDLRQFAQAIRDETEESKCTP